MIGRTDEGLLARDLHVVVDVDDDRGLEEETTRTRAALSSDEDARTRSVASSICA